MADYAGLVVHLLPEVCWAPLGLLLLLLLLDALSCISVAVFQGRIQLILESLRLCG